MPLIVALVVLPLAWWWGIATKWQYPNNHPLCHLCEQLSSCFFSTSLHSAALPSFHSESVFNTTFPFEHINHARSGMIFQTLHQGLQHPLKQNIPKCDSHYLSISVWSQAHHSSKSLLIQELRLPSVPPWEPRLTSPWVSRS